MEVSSAIQTPETLNPFTKVLLQCYRMRGCMNFLLGSERKIGGTPLQPLPLRGTRIHARPQYLKSQSAEMLEKSLENFSLRVDPALLSGVVDADRFREYGSACVEAMENLGDSSQWFDAPEMLLPLEPPLIALTHMLEKVYTRVCLKSGASAQLSREQIAPPKKWEPRDWELRDCPGIVALEQSAFSALDEMQWELSDVAEVIHGKGDVGVVDLPNTSPPVTLGMAVTRIEGKVLHLDHIAVHPAAQQMGVGSALLTMVKERRRKYHLASAVADFPRYKDSYGSFMQKNGFGWEGFLNGDSSPSISDHTVRYLHR